MGIENLPEITAKDFGIRIAKQCFDADWYRSRYMTWDGLLDKQTPSFPYPYGSGKKTDQYYKAYWLNVADQILALLPKPLDLSKLKVMEDEVCDEIIIKDVGMSTRLGDAVKCGAQAQYDSMVSEIKKQLGE